MPAPGNAGCTTRCISTRCLASHLEVDPNQVLVASTGVIGSFLPVPKMLKGIGAAASALNSRGGPAAVRAIMTTDTREKSIAVEGRIAGKTVRIGGMAKGAGMIHPQMATMIAVVTTDAQVPPGELSRTAAADCGTNLQLPHRRRRHVHQRHGPGAGERGFGRLHRGPSFRSFFEKGLSLVCEELAKSIARDGEGATKFVEILVRGAADFEAARKVAKTIAHSSLVKTALYGEELNWGRSCAPWVTAACRLIRTGSH